MAVASLFDPFTGQEKISDREKRLFLQSPAYCNLLRKMVVGLTSDHKLMVYLLPPESPDLAFTDGSHIMINTLHQLFIAQPVGDVTKYCLALAVHESLHPIYSCFECIEDADHINPIGNGVFDELIYLTVGIMPVAHQILAAK